MPPRWYPSPIACCAFHSPPNPRVLIEEVRLGRLHFDRHRAGRRQDQPRRRPAALAEGRGLELVARGVAVELETLRLGRRGFNRSRCASRSAMPSSGSNLIDSSRSPHLSLFIVGRATKRQALRPRIATAGPLFLNHRHDTHRTLRDCSQPPCSLSTSPPRPQSIDPKVQARIDRILKATPLIDGHNDLAEELRENYGGKIEGLAAGTHKWTPKALMTDMARLLDPRGALADNSGRCSSRPRSTATGQSVTRWKRSTSSSPVHRRLPARSRTGLYGR